jgi:hypothetical protein
MKWLKRKIRDWLRDANQDDEYSMTIGSNKIVASRDVEASMCDAEPILNFRVFGAVGGQVVEFRRYDRKTDRNDTTTYIITSEQDFGKAISHISTTEIMKL